jgi:hypothetical protein
MSAPDEKLNVLARVVWALEAVELGDLEEARTVLRDLEVDLSRAADIETKA